MSESIRISEEKINNFLQGKDPQTGIIAIECSYKDEEVSIIYKDGDSKRIKKDAFKPFIWGKQSGAKRLFVNPKTGYQDRALLRKKLDQYGIVIKSLNIYTADGRTTDRLEKGYRLMFMVNKAMSYSKFLRFFKDGGVDLYDESKDFLAVTPVEQYMMRTGKRFFKGFEDYDELLRFEFDLETGGLNPEIHRIDQVGMRTNKGFEKVIAVEGDTKQEKDRNELNAIKGLFQIISEIKPDVITGHNSENFDWNFIIVRCEKLGTTVKDISEKFFRQGLYKSARKTVLKLGGEMEYFNKTNLWGYNITDSLHAVRRAQAIDSNMKKADLKYVTKYSKLNKQNRVYIPGDKIGETWNDINNSHALNDSNGSWYQINDKHPLKEGYDEVTCKYVVERYLLDDLYETDKVELRYNQPNFLLGKLLPTTFARVCTMGTAGIWKLIMMAWSFENALGIPDFAPSRKFVGGLSRLLKVGFVGNVVKLDYNSLYPSIDITWSVEPDHDISHVMLSLLTYILDQREKYKDLKGVAKKKAKNIKEQMDKLEKGCPEYLELEKEFKHWDSEDNSNDKRQLPFKIFANSFFGGFGAPNLFPWGDVSCAEKTTCVGRQSLRLMVKWFSDRVYTPIVGDSFLYDTPIFVKYKNSNVIDIKTISEVFNKSECEIDGLGREYDSSNKPYQVLCRTGWVDIMYTYRHKTNKDIHRISFEDGYVDVTDDHSIFTDKKEKICSKDIIPNKTKLEMSDIDYSNIINNINDIDFNNAMKMGCELAIEINEHKRVPVEILNSNETIQKYFLNSFMESSKFNDNRYEGNKILNAGLQFLLNRVKVKNNI